MDFLSTDQNIGRKAKAMIMKIICNQQLRVGRTGHLSLKCKLQITTKACGRNENIENCAEYLLQSVRILSIFRTSFHLLVDSQT